jgi:hypothetical protein
MPFAETPQRDRNDLLNFFENNLKKVIENEKSFKENYLVSRSSDTFGITEQIIIDLFESDIVICDLSGIQANPNVMYELGIRLAISNNPVILIRESNPKNKKIFDIQGYFTFEYNIKQYNHLEKHLIDKISGFENNFEKYQSPVLKTLENAPGIIDRIIRQNNWDKLVLFQAGIYQYLSSLIRSIGHFVEGNGLNVEGGTENDFYKFLYTEEEKLNNLNWSEYKLLIPKIPALESFLSFPPITGLKLNSETHQRIISYVLTYYNHVVLNIQDLFDNKFIGIYRILAETSTLNQLAVELVTNFVIDNDLSKEVNLIIDKSALKHIMPTGIIMVRLPDKQ